MVREKRLYHVFIEIKNGRYYRAYIPAKPFDEAQCEAAKLNAAGESTIITCNPESTFVNLQGCNNTYFLPIRRGYQVI